MKMLELGRKKVFSGKETPDKVALLFLDIKILEERFA